MDGYLAKMTELNKQRTGPMTTNDLVKMQQYRGEAMAHMQYIKGANDQITQAAQQIANNPGKYNQKLFDQAYEQWITDGTLPDGPLLVEAFKNPMNLWSNFTQQFRQGATMKDVGDPYQTQTGAWAQPQQRVYPYADEYNEEALANQFFSGYNVPNTTGWFMQEVAESEPETYKRYMEKAEGDPVAAAKMWFDENKPPAYPELERTDKSRPSVYGMEQTIQFKNGGWWDRNQKLMGIADNIPVEGKTLDKAIVFVRKPAAQNLIPIPANVLDLGEGINTKSGTVEARVHAADNDKTYVVVDKNSLDKITFTKSAMKAYGSDNFEKLSSGEYKIKEGAEDDVMIAVNTSEVKGLIDNWTGDSFSDALKMLPSSSQGTYEINGESYTEQELKSAGWTDADIKRLKNR
jgi:hypothetical protein